MAQRDSERLAQLRERICLAPGWLTTVSARLPMSALNMGESNTVSLVIDSRKKADD